jgi:NADH-quinone oxidoreductase subunit E
MATESVLSIIEKHNRNGDGLISILEEIQSKFTYLPDYALREVARETRHSLTEIYGVATFYKAFSLKPRGKHLASVCLGTACHVRGGQAVADEFSSQLKVRPGDTTADGEFTLETVNCLGACALGPIVVIDGHYFSKVKTAKVKQIIKDAREGLDKIDSEKDKRVFPVDVVCPVCNHSLMDSGTLIDDSPSIRLIVSSGLKHGSLYLSSLYGSYTSQCSFEIKEGAVVHLFCPHCNTQFHGTSPCPECDEKMITLKIRRGGIVQLCPRKGCTGHRLDLS